MLAPAFIRELTRPAGPFAGLGLFSGRAASVRVIPPAPGSSGLLVRRISFDEVAASPATFAHLTDDTSWSSLPPTLPQGTTPQRLIRNTRLSVGHGPAASTVATIEHLLAAIAGLGIAHAIIEIEGTEVPILDGSSADFAQALVEASRPAGPSPRPARLSRPIRVDDPASGASIIATPIEDDEHPAATYHVVYDGPLAAALPEHFARQSATWTADPDGPANFAREVAPARTFSFEHEARAAQSLGMFRGFTASDLLVLRNDGTPVQGTLRFPNEPARHKLLDLIGDLALLGRPLRAHVTATRAGHALTHELVRAIASQAS
jgi:UDP-3-O-[3-hydroxymyristoyl] N-acetylglucosamine deacetylase